MIDDETQQNIKRQYKRDIIVCGVGVRVLFVALIAMVYLQQRTNNPAPLRYSLDACAATHPTEVRMGAVCPPWSSCKTTNGGAASVTG